MGLAQLHETVGIKSLEPMLRSEFRRLHQQVSGLRESPAQSLAEPGEKKASSDAVHIGELRERLGRVPDLRHCVVEACLSAEYVSQADASPCLPAAPVVDRGRGISEPPKDR